MSTDADMNVFFSSRHYAVVGASNNTAKFGFKVFAWYLNHDLPVTPITPMCQAITVAGKQHATVSRLSDLKDPERVSISVITPPHVTLSILEQAKAVGIKAVWLQPGTFNQEVETFARENFKAVLAGLHNSQAHQGWCILVDGERGLKNAEKL